MTEFFNRASETKRRRYLRNSMPKAEVLLWCKLKGKQVGGARFRRQYSVGPFVLDFYCPQVKLAIEVDGDSHFLDDGRRDTDRQRYIEGFGIRFLRFTNTDIYSNLDGVVGHIWHEVAELAERG